MKIIVSLLLVLMAWVHVQAQGTSVSFQINYGEHEIKLNKKYSLQLIDSVELSTLKFYLSDFAFLTNDHKIAVCQKTIKLVDCEKKSSADVFPVQKISQGINAFTFHLGIDSITSSDGVMGGDLDPMLGMYWTWQNGYIHLKMEGKIYRTSGDIVPFEYHIGGYQYPYNTLQTIILPLKSTGNITVIFDVKKFLSGIDANRPTRIMSPGADAVQLATKAASAFSIQQL